MNHEAREGHEAVEANGPHRQFGPVDRAVVDAGLKVHRLLGPGLLESVYQQCLAHELGLRGLQVRQQVALPVRYEGLQIEAAYRIDLLVENCLIVEVKAVEQLARLHTSQLLTYLRLSGIRLGLLVNFNVSLFKSGLRRLVL